MKSSNHQSLRYLREFFFPFTYPYAPTASGINLSLPRWLAILPPSGTPTTTISHGASEQFIALPSLLCGKQKQPFEPHSLAYSTRFRSLPTCLPAYRSEFRVKSLEFLISFAI